MLKILEASELSPESKRERIDLELKADPTRQGRWLKGSTGNPRRQQVAIIND